MAATLEAHRRLRESLGREPTSGEVAMECGIGRRYAGYCLRAHEEEGTIPVRGVTRARPVPDKAGQPTTWGYGIHPPAAKVQPKRSRASREEVLASLEAWRAKVRHLLYPPS